MLDNGADANWLGDRKFSSSLAHHEHPALVSAVLASRTDIVELLLKDGPGVMIIEEALSVARRLGRYRSYITYRSPSENPLSDIEKMLELYKVTQNTQRVCSQNVSGVCRTCALKLLRFTGMDSANQPTHQT